MKLFIQQNFLANKELLHASLTTAENINIILSKWEVGYHAKQTTCTSMAKVYLNDTVVLERTFKRTFQLLLKHLGYTYMYIQTKESADGMLIIDSALSSLTGYKYNAGDLHCYRSAGAHLRTK